MPRGKRPGAVPPDAPDASAKTIKSGTVATVPATESGPGVATAEVLGHPAPGADTSGTPTLRDVFIAEARGDPEAALVARRVPIRFDPESWLQDRALRGCSPAARGIWMDVLCLMHTSPVYGKLLGPDRNPYTYTDLAAIMLVDRRTVKAMMEELLQRGVCDIDPQLGVPVSRRMRRDLALSASSMGPVSGDRVSFSFRGRANLPGGVEKSPSQGDDNTMKNKSRPLHAPDQPDLFAQAPAAPSVESFVLSIDPEARQAIASGDATGDAAQRYFDEASVEMPQSGVSGGRDPTLSSCPIEILLEAYNAHSGLASVRISQFMRNSARRAKLERRWQECFKRHIESSVMPYYATVHAGIESWTFFFKAIRDMPGLHGGFGSWTADLDWIIGRENFDKLLYHPDRYRSGAQSMLESSAVEAFIAAYPKDRIGMRKEVVAAWGALNLDAASAAVMSGLEAWKQSADWVRDGGRYVPSARRFLVEARYQRFPETRGDAGSLAPGGHHESRAASSVIAMRKALKLGSHPDESGDWRIIRFDRQIDGLGAFEMVYLVSENKIVVESAPSGIKLDARALRYVRDAYGDRASLGLALYDKLHPYVRALADVAVGRLRGDVATGSVRAPTPAEEAGVLHWVSTICPQAKKSAS